MMSVESGAVVDSGIGEALEKYRGLAEKPWLSEEVMHRANEVYSAARDRGLLRGAHHSTAVLGSLYVAIRDKEAPVTAKDLWKASGVEPVEIIRSYRLLVRGLGLEMKPERPEIFVPRLAEGAGVDDPETPKLARRLLRKAREEGITDSKSPSGLAAASLHEAIRRRQGTEQNSGKATQRALAELADVREVTVRHHAKVLRGLNV